MLLNEVQQQQKKIAIQDAQIRGLKQLQKTVAQMQKQLTEMREAYLTPLAKDELAARR